MQRNAKSINGNLLSIYVFLQMYIKFLRGYFPIVSFVIMKIVGI